MVVIPFFSEQGHVVFQIKENHECSNIVANILPLDPLLDPGSWSRVKVQLFRTWSYAYQDNWNPKCSNMVEHI